MKVLCISENRFLIKGEWYTIKEPTNGNVYHLVNHTNRYWGTSYFSKVNFITLQELREQQLNKILKVGDIVKVRYLPGSRYIIRDIGPIFILLEGSDMLFWESEISLHEDQLKQNQRDTNLKSLLND